MTYPFVSVVIPTYNYAKYITQAIESVLGQTYPNIEIIVIDDGSTDDTASVVGKFGDRIHYHFQANRGLSAARNRGIALSSGTYIQFLDSDDKLGPQAIEAKVRFLNLNQDIVFVCGPNRLFSEGGSRFYDPLKNLLLAWRLPNKRDIVPALCHGNIAPVHAFLTRLGAIRDSGIYFDESLKACEDYDFWLRIATNYGVPGIVTEGTAFYRKHSRSMSSNSNNQLRHDAVMIERAYAALCQKELSPAALKRECLTGNLAATIKIYFRLRRNGSDETASRLSDHIGRLLIQLEATGDTSQGCTTLYLSEMRVFALKLSREKFSLSASAAELIDAIVGRRLIRCWGYIYENLKVGNTIPELMDIFYLDLQYFYLKLGHRARITNRP